MAISFENPKEYIAELIGTAIIMAIGITVGSASLQEILIYNGSPSSSLLVAFGFAMAFIGLVYFIGSACNCHFNPLISLSMFINGRMKANDLLWYVLAQFIGGILGALFAFYLVTQLYRTDMVAIYVSTFGRDCVWAQSIEVIGAFLIEMMCAFILCSVALKATKTNKIDAKAGIIIGFTTFALIFIAGEFLMTAVNPAMSLGAAIAVLFSAAPNHAVPIAQIWLFIIAPALGAVIASITYMVVNSEEFDVDAMLANAKAKSAARREAREAERAANAQAAEEAAAEEPAAEEPVAEDGPVAEEEIAEEPVAEEEFGDIPEIESEEPAAETPSDENRSY